MPIGDDGAPDAEFVPDGRSQHDRRPGNAKAPDVSRVPVSVADWIKRDLAEPDRLMGEWLTTTSRVMFVAGTGLGKTNFAMALGMAVAAGADFLHWKGRRPAKVLYVDGEMSRRLFRSRIRDAVARQGSAPAGFYAFSHEDLEDFAPLNTGDGQAAIDAVIKRIGGVDLIIFDAVMCLTSGDMKDEVSWQETLPWVRKLTGLGIGQIWVHHTGHDETRSYGTKTREWQLDTVMLLETVRRDDTDISFSVTFTKARERAPATRYDFERAKIALVGDRWTVDAGPAEPPKKVSPLGLKFLDALKAAIATSPSTGPGGRDAASLDRWRDECSSAELIDLKGKPGSARALLNKHRRELVSAKYIASEGKLSWLV